MGGALLVSLITFARVGTREMSWSAIRSRCRRGAISMARLVGGAALFGVGWGLSGYCPGPAVASLLIGGFDVACFIGAMAAAACCSRAGGRLVQSTVGSGCMMPHHNKVEARDIVVVQSMRNTIMVASVLASAALLA